MQTFTDSLREECLMHVTKAILLVSGSQILNWVAFSDVPMSGKTDSRDFIYPENRLFKSPEIWNDYPITGYRTVCMPD